MDDRVDLVGGDSRHDLGSQRVENLGGQPAGGAHAGKAFRPVELDPADAADDARLFGCVIVSIMATRYRRAEPIWPLTVQLRGRNGCGMGQALMTAAMAGERIWTAALLIIGDEILSGRTQDRNVAQIASWLNLQGIRLSEVRIVPDVERADRRGGERASRRQRLSVHHRRHRPDP